MLAENRTSSAAQLFDAFHVEVLVMQGLQSQQLMQRLFRRTKTWARRRGGGGTYRPFAVSVSKDICVYKLQCNFKTIEYTHVSPWTNTPTVSIGFVCLSHIAPCFQSHRPKNRLDLEVENRSMDRIDFSQHWKRCKKWYVDVWRRRLLGPREEVVRFLKYKKDKSEANVSIWKCTWEIDPFCLFLTKMQIWAKNISICQSGCIKNHEAYRALPRSFTLGDSWHFLGPCFGEAGKW